MKSIFTASSVSSTPVPGTPDARCRPSRVHADAPGALMDTTAEFTMKTTRFLAAFATCLLATAAWAQSDTSTRPLNLNLPPTDFPASSSTAPKAATASPTGSPAAKDPPGTYYGDTSGRMPNREIADDGTPRCDDATYNKPQVHGSLSTGVVSSSRGGSGSYQAGEVNLTQAFGSCEHPTGGVSISVGSGTGHFHR